MKSLAMHHLRDSERNYSFRSYKLFTNWVLLVHINTRHGSAVQKLYFAASSWATHSIYSEWGNFRVYVHNEFSSRWDKSESLFFISLKFFSFSSAFCRRCRSSTIGIFINRANFCRHEIFKMNVQINFVVVKFIFFVWKREKKWR